MRVVLDLSVIEGTFTALPTNHAAIATRNAADLRGLEQLLEIVSL